MAEHRRLKVGVVGAGHISTIYLTNMTTTFSDYLDVRAVSATRIESAQKQADKYGIRAMTTPDLLADPEIELVVNLTPVPAHYDIIKTALTNGKHVYTESFLPSRRKRACTSPPHRTPSSAPRSRAQKRHWKKARSGRLRPFLQRRAEITG